MVSMDCETSGLDSSAVVHVTSLYDGRAGTAVSFAESTHGPEFVGAALEACAAQRDVVTFNGCAYDYKVLARNAPDQAARKTAARLALTTRDILLNFACDTGYFSSLASFASATLGESKTSDGAAAVDDWNAGRHAEVTAYCEHDAKLTLQLYTYACKWGRLERLTKAGRKSVWACSHVPLHPTTDALQAYAASPPDTAWMQGGGPDVAALADWAVDILAA
jgi:hypothetical protein